MHYFHYKNHELYCENVRVAAMAEKYGTPLYLYSSRTLAEHYQKLDEAFESEDHLICYSVKANSNLALLKNLCRIGSGFDIVSGGELYKVLRVGADPQKIVYAGVGKTFEEINFALKSDILMFNVESEAEILAIQTAARRRRQKARICLRVNPDVNVDTHHYIVTGKKGNKFGISIKNSRKLFKDLTASKYIQVAGLHFHLGSQILNPKPYAEAIGKVLGLFNEARQMGHPLSILNIGGGMGIGYDNEAAFSAREFAKIVLAEVRGRHLRLLLEPGRYLVGNAGILVTRVLYRKENGGKKFVIVDAGMNDLIRPSLYGAHHAVLPLKERRALQETVDVVGPICESGDFLAKDRRLAKVNAGDYLAVMGAGAYGFTMSSNYNSRPRAAEVLVQDRRFILARKREAFQDLVKGEKLA